MSDDRLTFLAAGYINQERTANAHEVLTCWDQSGHRWIATAFREQL